MKSFCERKQEVEEIKATFPPPPESDLGMMVPDFGFTKESAVELLGVICNQLHEDMEKGRMDELDLDKFYFNTIALFWGLSDAVEFGDKDPESVMKVAFVTTATLLNKLEEVEGASPMQK